VEVLYRTPFMIPKNKKGGVVSNTVMGIGGLIISVIIILVVVTTVFQADLLKEDERTVQSFGENTTVMNETYAILFGNYTLPGATCTVQSATNETGYIIGPANYKIIQLIALLVKFIMLQ